MREVRLRRFRGCIAAALLCAIVLPVEAQTFPSRTMRFYVGFTPGTGSDLVSRLLAQKMGERFGQPVIVEQKISSGGVLASEAVVKSPPDGHSMVLLSGIHPVLAAMRKSLPYDPVRDFGTVSLVSSYPIVISVASDSPVKSLSDLLARAKAAPGRITYSMGSTGSLLHLLGEWMNIEAGTTMVPVPFKGSAPALMDLLGGRIDAMIDTGTASFGQMRAGKIRALALSTGARYPLAPEVPTMAEAVPGVEARSWLGVAVAPATPRAIINRLNSEVRAVIELPEVRQRLADMGGIALASTPEEMRDRIEGEIKRWTRVVKLRNIERQ
jgi:tripartite-type tricarboxylate transporter receptor subunit TctC